MSRPQDASVHASAVLVERRAVLDPRTLGSRQIAARLRSHPGRARRADSAGDAGWRRSGPSRSSQAVELMVRPAPQLAGLIEIRGLGIRRCEFAAEAVVGLVVDLAAPDAERLPPPEALLACIHGVEIPRIPVGSGFPAAAIGCSRPDDNHGFNFVPSSADCLKGIGNHMSAQYRDRIDRRSPPLPTANFRENCQDPLLRGGSGWSKWRVRAVHQKAPARSFR